MPVKSTPVNMTDMQNVAVDPERNTETLKRVKKKIVKMLEPQPGPQETAPERLRPTHSVGSDQNLK